MISRHFNVWLHFWRKDFTFSKAFWWFHLNWIHHWRKKAWKPVCLFIDHRWYEWHDFGGGYRHCKHCNKTIRLWKPIPIIKKTHSPQNVSVSLYDAGNGELKVWGVSFTLTKDNTDKRSLKDKEKEIQRAIEGMKF